MWDFLLYTGTQLSRYSDSQTVLPSSMSISCVRISRSPNRQHVQHAVLGLLRRAEYCENVTTHPATATAARRARPDTTVRSHSVDIQTDKHADRNRTVKAKFHYASWFGAGSNFEAGSKPNSITLSGSNQLRTSSETVANQLRTSSEQTPNQTA